MTLARALRVAAAAQALTLNLPGAVRYALDHNAAVVKQQAVVAQAQQQVVKTRSASLPNVTGLLQNTSQKSNNLQGSFAIAGLSQARTFSQNTAQIGTNYTVYTGGLSIIQSYVARAQLDAAQAELRKTRDGLANDVAGDFYAVASKDETVRLDRSDVDYQHVLLQAAQAKERAGVAAGVDVLRAQASEQRSRSALAADQAQASDARETLAQLIGAPLDTTFDVPVAIAQPALPPNPLEGLIAIAQAHRPDVTGAQFSLSAAQLTRQTWGRELFPQIQIGAAFGNQFAPTISSPLPNVPRGVPGFWQLQAVSTFSLPLVDYGARNAERENDDAQVTAAQSALDSAKEQVALEVRQAYRAAQTAKTQLQYTGDEVRAAVESARIARLQYENGLIAITDVLAAQQAALSAQTDLYNARVAYVEAVVKLRVALGIFDATSAVEDL